MTLNNNRLYNIVDSLYTYFKVSLYFWVSILKGFIFYGFIPASCALFLTIDFIKEKKEEGDLKEKFNAFYKQYEKYKLQSFILTFLFLFFYVVLIYLSKHLQSPIALTLIIVVGYVLILLSVLFVYCVYFLCFSEESFKHSMILSFVTAIKNLKVTFAILVINILLMYIAYLNLAFFVIFGPFLFALGVRFVLQRLTIRLN
jgi:uncharacterized membrane protein YesL